jgi:hypothetical protein
VPEVAGFETARRDELHRGILHRFYADQVRVDGRDVGRTVRPLARVETEVEVLLALLFICP